MLPISYNNKTKPVISLFDDIFNFNNFMSFDIPNILRPIHDVIENENEYIIDMQLAGIKKEDIKIDIDKDIVTIKAERKENKELNYNRKQSFTGTYQKSFNLPDNVDIDKIDASLADGILSIKIPKLETQKITKKVIEIK